MQFEIKGVLADGVEVRAEGGYSGVAGSKMNEEQLAQAVLFFWRALVAFQVMKGQGSVDKVAEEVLIGEGKAMREDALKCGRNILVGKMKEKA